MLAAFERNKPSPERGGPGEIASNARRLVSVKGTEALSYARNMAGIKSKKDQKFWKGIAEQIEWMLYGPPPDRM